MSFIRGGDFPRGIVPKNGIGKKLVTTLNTIHNPLRCSLTIDYQSATQLGGEEVDGYAVAEGKFSCYLWQFPPVMWLKPLTLSTHNRLPPSHR